MTKEAKLYCEAMNAEYKNKCLCKLVKYKKALLNIPDGMDKSPGSYMALELAREKLHSEIERKKKKYSSLANKIFIGVIIGLIVLAATIFANKLLNRPTPQKQLPQQQQEGQNI